MKFVILLALAGFSLAGPILNNTQQDVRILSDGSVIVSNGLGKRIFIQKSTESKGNLEIIIRNSNGLTRVIEISSPTQIIKDVVKNSANIDISASVVQTKPVDGKKDKSKGPVVNGEIQLKTLQMIVREFQGIIDTTTYIELLNKISTSVNNGELNKVILEALRTITDDQKQIQLVGDVNSGEDDSTHQQSVPSTQPQNPMDIWNNYQAQNSPWVGQTATSQWNPTPSWYQTTPPSTSTFGAQNNFKVKFGPGGPFGPFGPFSPYAPVWWNSTMAAPVNPWVASNPWIQSNPWVANNPWVSPNAWAPVVPQTQTQANDEDSQSTASSFGEQNNFAVKFGALGVPWWLPITPIDAQIKEAVKYQKNALKNLQQLQQLKLAQSTAIAQGTGTTDGSVPTIDYDSAIQSAQEVLQFAQKNVGDLALQKQQQQLALQFGQPPTGQTAATAAGQQPVNPDVTQSFYVNHDINESGNVPESTHPDSAGSVPNFFTSFKVKPTKAPKSSKIADAPPIAQTKVAAVIQQRIQAIQDQWNQQNLVNQQLLQQQAQVGQQLKQLQDQIQVARAQGASPELLNQLQLVQQDLSNRQMLLIQQQVNQQAITNGLHAQLAVLNDQLKNVPDANIPEGAMSWQQILGIPAGGSKQGGTITRVPLQGGLQNFSPV